MVQRVEDPVVKAADLSAIPGTHITERDNSCKLSFDFFTEVLTVLKQRASFFLAEASCSIEIEHSLVFYCCVTNEPNCSPRSGGRYQWTQRFPRPGGVQISLVRSQALMGTDISACAPPAFLK